MVIWCAANVVVLFFMVCDKKIHLKSKAAYIHLSSNLPPPQKIIFYYFPFKITHIKLINTFQKLMQQTRQLFRTFLSEFFVDFEISGQSRHH
jgi:hypothetical protein